MKIVFPDLIGSLTDETFTKLKDLGDITIYQDMAKTPGEYIERVKDAEIIVVRCNPITQEIIEQTPKLRYIITLNAGYDMIDISFSATKGIRVINCPTYNSRAVVEFTLGLILAITRRISQAHSAIKQGLWKNHFDDFRGMELMGKKIGIIGHGHIGKTVGELALAFGMNVSFADSKTTDEELDEIIKTSDIISINAPLTEKTKHMIDKRRLLLMKKTAYLVNTGRGAIIDQEALIEVITSGHLAGVALDVFEDEPKTGTVSKQLQEFANQKNVILTPHIAFNTLDSEIRLGEELLKNLDACLADQPINVVNQTSI